MNKDHNLVGCDTIAASKDACRTIVNFTSWNLAVQNRNQVDCGTIAANRDVCRTTVNFASGCLL